MYEIKFLYALLLTIILETCALYLGLRYVFKVKNAQTTIKVILFTGILCSAATLPYVWFLFPAFIKNFILFTGLAEIFAITIESLMIYFIIKLSYKKSLALSIICNAFSYLLGEVFKDLLY